ncbi:MAG: Holliday junction resolvase RuvX [Burkholderiaceae bacterium]|jgi:putative Holliday junction resolvase|nr:Holliday junction resolvase RuvX [Burkholderiaceae bacterium]
MPDTTTACPAGLSDRITGEGSILAFDFGLKKIGVAIGNSLLRRAHPLNIIHEETRTARFDTIAYLVREWEPIGFVVGLPLYPDGAAHDMTRRCKRFANQLRGRFGIRTALVDERYSSCVSGSLPHQADDARAAALILQQYFDDTHTG